MIKIGTPAQFPEIQEGSLEAILSSIYHISSDLSFGLIWLATALLLRHYRHEFGRIRFWILISLPLVYYVSTSIDTLGLYLPNTDYEQFLFYVYSSLNSAAGAILFGFSFWIGSTKLPPDNVLKTYMKIVAFGFVLLFISSEASLLAASYPPFGLATVSLFGLASYLILTGLDLTAAALAADIKLRTLIKGLTVEYKKLLGSMGQSELESLLTKKVTEILKKDIHYMVEQETESLSHEQIYRYVNQTVNETKKRTESSPY